jgi:hypothetical protein
LLSLQVSWLPDTHVPETQVSDPLHTLPSLQELLLSLEKTQPLAVLHVSSVQGLPSLHVSGVPGWQEPPEQVSAPLHALPSPHGLLFGALTQPKAALQVSVVHTLLSLQFRGTPVQTPPTQPSPTVQLFWSSQSTELLECTQPMDGLHESVVQILESSQLGGDAG